MCVQNFKQNVYSLFLKISSFSGKNCLASEFLLIDQSSSLKKRLLLGKYLGQQFTPFAKKALITLGKTPAVGMQL